MQFRCLWLQLQFQISAIPQWFPELRTELVAILLPSSLYKIVGRKIFLNSFYEDGFWRLHFLCTTCYVRSFTVKVIAHPDNSTSFEVIESQLENPLIDAKHRDLLNMKPMPFPVGHHHRNHHKRNQTDDFEREFLIIIIILFQIKKIYLLKIYIKNILYMCVSCAVNKCYWFIWFYLQINK